jgi:hypothetical protein
MVARFGIANPGLPIADWQLPITLNFRIRSGYVSSAIANCNWQSAITFG